MVTKERVTRVVDGDTFYTANRKRPLRLANVNAPERGAKGGTAATRKLRGLIAGQTVSIDTKARDVYGRYIVDVKAGGKSVNNAVKGKPRKKRRIARKFL